MRVKFGRSCRGVIFAMIGINCAFAGPPAGLREALAEFETGALTPEPCAADRVIGGRNEVSRFQILPVVWRQYSTSRNYHDPHTAWNVANKILSEREQAFRQATKREWDFMDIYLMWNAPGLYRRANWNRTRVSPVVLKRAQRFANLMQARSQLHATQGLARN
jgi:hypothetical protein